MAQISNSLKRRLDFTLALTEREIKTKYKSGLPILTWLLLYPLTQLAVIGIIFRYFFAFKPEDYFLYLFSGLIVWNYFSSSINRSTVIITENRTLIKKASFPKETMVISAVLANLLPMIVSCVLLSLAIIIMGVNLSPLRSLAIIASLFLITVFIIGIGLALSALNVRYRGTNHAVGLLTPLLFYASPVIYSSQILPEGLDRLLYINPLVGLIDIFRWSFLGRALPNIGLAITDLILVIVGLFIGVYIFIHYSKNFDDWL